MPIVKCEGKPKSVAVNARLPSELNAELVAYSQWAGVGKSAVVQTAIRRLLRQDTEWQTLKPDAMTNGVDTVRSKSPRPRTK